VGLRDHYRQYRAMTPREAADDVREQAGRRRSAALERVQPLDLSATTWPQLPPSAVVNAVTYAARRGLHRAPDPTAAALSGELRQRLGLTTGRVVVGNGAAQLLGAAVAALVGPGDELVTPWPAYPLPAMAARRAGGSAVAVTGRQPAALLEALTPRTRVVALCNPNDPTGAWLDRDAVGELLDGVGQRVVVLIDEALAEYAPDSAVELVQRHPRLLVVRTFSKAWGLAGLRVGYAVGGPDSEPLLERIAPELGVGELGQAGALEALRSTGAQLRRRVQGVRAQRERLAAALAQLGIDVPPSAANVLWLRAPGLDGAQLAGRLRAAGVIVADGAPLGDPARVRVAVHDAAASDRLLAALAGAVR
jgi:histidinol-phosphate aminotransferase